MNRIKGETGDRENQSVNLAGEENVPMRNDRREGARVFCWPLAALQVTGALLIYFVAASFDTK